eukprot:scaffold307_cov146-Skeletonema_menzelii.AAC.30
MIIPPHSAPFRPPIYLPTLGPPRPSSVPKCKIKIEDEKRTAIELDAIASYLPCRETLML